MQRRLKRDEGVRGRNGLRSWIPALAALVVLRQPLQAQTDGGAALHARILDYVGTSNTRHWTVVWVTTGSGTFIKTLWKQGPTLTSSHWNDHCGVWYAAKAGSTALDGYSSATAANYAGTNSPVILTWDCRDAHGELVADGNYKFWVQYAEDSGQGPYILGGLLWAKGPAGSTNTYPNQGVNFADLRVTWAPTTVLAEPPVITSLGPTPSATLGVLYQFGCTATGTEPITFTAMGLPPGLTISAAGVISGVPTVAGTYHGTITAANGTLPNATQPFVIEVTPLTLTAVQIEAGALVLSGRGPANATYHLLASTDLLEPAVPWTVLATNAFASDGSFQVTHSLDPGQSRRFYKLRLP